MLARADPVWGDGDRSCKAPLEHSFQDEDPFRRDRNPTEAEPQSTADDLRRMRVRVDSLWQWQRLTLARPPAPKQRFQPRVHGSGTGWALALPAPSVAIARDRSFAPTRSARTPAVVKLATMPAGEAGSVGRARVLCAHDEPTGQSLLARGLPDEPACAGSSRRSRTSS
jgi:hypothetical protein